MVFHPRFLILIALVFAATSSRVFANELAYKLHDAKKWSRDTELNSYMSGPEHFIFASTEDIDLNIIPMTEDLKASLKTRGLDQFSKDLLNGKNKINGLFGVGESKLIEKSLIQEPSRQILALRCRQTIDPDAFEILEKYYIYEGQTLHAELRWNVKTDPAKIKAAQDEFSKLVVVPEQPK